MRRQTTGSVAHAIDFIEANLSERTGLDQVARELHYSRYHLHRMFAGTVGLTIHEYGVRRRLTEAARLLVYSRRPILDIALGSGYESQQAFTGAFKAMYKVTPDQFRRAGRFYPLQMKICLRECSGKTDFSKEDIRFAVWEDMEEWMELVHFSIDGYPCLEEASYKERLRQCIAREEALVLREKEMLIGVMGISREKGSIEFLAVHPQYRRHNIEAVFLEKLAEDLFCGREISTTTFREGDRADTGYRQVWRSLGFVERELLMEYGYPTQRLVLPPVKEETIWKDRKKYVSF